MNPCKVHVGKIIEKRFAAQEQEANRRWGFAKDVDSRVSILAVFHGDAEPDVWIPKAQRTQNQVPFVLVV
jgi:hypothetical protein